MGLLRGYLARGMVISGDAYPVRAKSNTGDGVVLDHLPGRQPDLLAAGIGVVLHFLLTEVCGRKLEIADHRLATDPANAVSKQPNQYQDQKSPHQHATSK